MQTLIPIKSLVDAKSRLSKNFSQIERQKLVLNMLDHVLEVLFSNKKIAHISLVTPDEIIVQHIKNLPVSVVPEEKSGYNQSLTLAAQKENKNEKIITLPADLPLLTTEDVNELIRLSQQYDIVLAPSKDNGTNAVLMQFPLQLPYLFGKDSFEKYKTAAKKNNLTVGVYKNKTITFDIDTPEDVIAYNKIKEKDQL